MARNLTTFLPSEHRTGRSLSLPENLALYGDNIDLMHHHRPIVDCGTQSDLQLTTEAARSLVNVPLLNTPLPGPGRAASAHTANGLSGNITSATTDAPEDPTVGEGEPTIIRAVDHEGHGRFGMVVTESVIKSYKIIAEEESRQRVLIQEHYQIGRAKAALHSVLDRVETSNGDQQQSESCEESPIEPERALEIERMKAQLAQLAEKQEDSELRQSSVERNIRSEKDWIILMFEKVLSDELLLTKNEHAIRYDSSPEDNLIAELVGGEGRTDAAELEVSEEEKARVAARENFESAREKLDMAQHGFDCREWRHTEALAQYEAALAAGETTDTKTVFDHYVLSIDRDLTRDLIEAENAYYEAEEQAEHRDILRDFNDDNSCVMLAPDDDPATCETEPLSDAHHDRILAWTHTVSDSEDANVEKMVDVDDWEARTVLISDSLSVFDQEGYRRKIDRWETMREDTRKHFKIDEEDVWCSEERPAKRRRTYSI